MAALRPLRFAPAIALLTLGSAPLVAQAGKPPVPKITMESAYATNPLGCVIRLRFLQTAANGQNQAAKDAAAKEQAAAMRERAHRGVYFYAAQTMALPAAARSAEAAEAEVKAFAGYPRERQAVEAMKCLRVAETELVSLGDTLRGPQVAEPGR